MDGDGISVHLDGCQVQPDPRSRFLHAHWTVVHAPPSCAGSIMGEALGWNETPILDTHTYLMCYI